MARARDKPSLVIDSAPRNLIFLKALGVLGALLSATGYVLNRGSLLWLWLARAVASEAPSRAPRPPGQASRLSLSNPACRLPHKLGGYLRICFAFLLTS